MLDRPAKKLFPALALFGDAPVSPGFGFGDIPQPPMAIARGFLFARVVVTNRPLGTSEPITAIMNGASVAESRFQARFKKSTAPISFHK
jgi:hypothetical protein